MNILTKLNIGIEVKKDNFAASTLLKFKNLAPVIIIPDLLTPGIRDKIWNNPIIKTFLLLKLFRILLLVFFKSLKNKIMPKIIVDQPIILKLLKKSI